MFQQIEVQSRLGSFALHLLIATLGTLLVTTILSVIVSWIAGPHFASFIALGPVFLLPILSGVALGYPVAKILPARPAVWVWVVPAVLLGVNIAGMLTSSYERPRIWVEEFGPYTQCEACLDQPFLTAPFVGCIGYAIGAGLLKGKKVNT